MFITNTRTVNWQVIYKTLGGLTKRETIPAGKQVEIVEIEGINQVLFDPYLRKVRSINDRLERGIEEGFEFRLTPGSTGSTL